MIAPSNECEDERDCNSQFLEFQLDLNKADKSELTLLPRIGVALATRIVAYRSENDGFQEVDELLNVKGIGPKTLERIRPYCRVVKEEDNTASSSSSLPDTL